MVLGTSMVLIGTFIGAGFASGQEIWQYFGVFGKMGFLGVLISCLLLFGFTYCTADNILYLGSREYVRKICGFKLANWLLNCYMILMFCTMITAFGECLNQIFSLPKIFGVLLIDITTLIILYFGASGVVKLNVFVTPLIILGIIFANFTNNTADVFLYNNYMSSAVIYTSYNVVAMPFVLVGMRELLSDKRKIFFSSVIFSGTIFALAVCLLNLLKSADVSVAIPLLDVVNGNYTYVFIVILAMSMLTTAVSNGYGFLSATSLNSVVMIVTLGIAALLFSLFSFNFIVKYFYRFFGYTGIYILTVNFYIFIKNREKPRKLKN